MSADGTEGRDFDLDLTDVRLDSRYHVKRLLAEGGMGRVYVATDENLARNVVIKVPHVKLLADAGFQDRFDREIRSLIGLDHPHVVKVMDVGSVRGVPYAVLQYLGGGDLADELKKASRLPRARDLLGWLPDIAGALDFIHSKGFVHRDVKPGNIMFDENGYAFLGDFGIVRALGDADGGLTQTGLVPGSPRYMAPEVGLGRALTPAYDQYALAVVAYRTLAGRAPHEADTPMAVLTKKATEPPVPLDTLRPDLPPGAVAALMRALSLDPEGRFTSCTDFARAYSEAASAEETPAGLRQPSPMAGAEEADTVEISAPTRPAAAQREARPVRRGRWGRRFAVLAVLAAVAGAVWIARHRLPLSGLLEPTARPPAEEPPVRVQELVGADTAGVTRDPPRDDDPTGPDTTDRKAAAVPAPTRAAAPVEAEPEPEMEPEPEVAAPAPRQPVPTETRPAVKVLPPEPQPKQPPPVVAAPVHERAPADDTPPELLRLDPPDGAAFDAGRVDLSGVVRESDLAAVQADGWPCAVDAPAFRCELDLPRGPADVRLLLEDRAGNVSSQAVRYEVRRPALAPAGRNRLGHAVYDRPSDGGRLVLVPGGSFVMGSAGGGSDETPTRRVTLSAYLIDEREVTWAQYARYRKDHGIRIVRSPSWNPGADHPVVNLDWEEARSYCEWAGGRLPTEAEWEHAARGPGSVRYPWGDEWADRRANWAGSDGHAKTSPVGSFPSGASPFGLLDMAGNVSEWVNDWYDAGSYARDVAVNPRGPTSGNRRSVRGGDFSYDVEQGLRAANRTSKRPDEVLANVGFRCAQNPP